jgi:hypothetical protein
MKRPCLVCAEALFAEMPQAEAELHFDTYSASAPGTGKSGDYLGGERLGSPPSAMAPRVRKGRVLTTDGPFAETKEQLRLP